MPRNSIMAFCTFYDRLDRLQRRPDDPFDYGYGGISGLTRLHFVLKKSVAENPSCTLTPQFDVTLYPNSAFFIPLSTNRLYTHEIRPSALEAKFLPTRMGYVVRCSSTAAVHKHGVGTFIKDGTTLKKLEPPTQEGMVKLRELYSRENITDEVIDYGQFLFSMNDGDYLKPTVVEKFRWLMLPSSRGTSNVFDELHSAVIKFDDVTSGRKGQTLVRPESRGIPIVRTTTRYSSPAQCFHPSHETLAQDILKEASLPGPGFNNALIEVYNNAYTSMGFHSDQALDLADDSYIALYSCYKFSDSTEKQLRKLVVESKEPGGGQFEIPLVHNSVVVFSVETNRLYRHKIVLDIDTYSRKSPPENDWLGVTFRTSKTFVHTTSSDVTTGGEGIVCFEDGTPLKLADDEQSKEFYKLRRRENEETDFSYPEEKMTFTLSESDLMPPSHT